MCFCLASSGMSVAMSLIKDHCTITGLIRLSTMSGNFLVDFVLLCLLTFIGASARTALRYDALNVLSLPLWATKRQAWSHIFFQTRGRTAALWFTISVPCDASRHQIFSDCRLLSVLELLILSAAMQIFLDSYVHHLEHSTFSVP